MLSQYELKASRRSVLATCLAAFVIIAPLSTAYATRGTLSNSVDSEINSSEFVPEVQKIAASEIAAAVKKYHAKSGAIAVANPQTGKIIAFAEFGSIKNSGSWASRIFAPGSTIKPFVAAAAIEDGVATEQKIYDCRAPYNVNGTEFMNADNSVGNSTLTNAMANSINICFMKMAKELGAKNLQDKLTAFGFNVNNQENTNADEQLATEAIGTTIPVDIATLTKAYAILANKGHSFSVNSNAVVSETTANSVTRMLVDTVEHGTGKRAGISNEIVAGKTGTLIPELENETSTSHLALFAGYVPANAPRFVAVVVMEDGKNAQKNAQKYEMASGGAVAAPVFHNVAEKSLTTAMLKKN